MEPILKNKNLFVAIFVRFTGFQLVDDRLEFMISDLMKFKARRNGGITPIKCIKSFRAIYSRGPIIVKLAKIVLNSFEISPGAVISFPWISIDWIHD